MRPRESEPVESGSRGVVLAPRWAVIGIFLLLSVAGLAYAKAFLMPVALAFMLAFVFSPMRRFMERWWRCPPALSAFVIVGSLVAMLAAGGLMLAAPASDWIASAPSIGRELNSKLRDLRDAAEGVRQAAEQVDQIAGGNDPQKADERRGGRKQEGVTTRLAASAPAILAQVVLTLVLLFFILASGDMIYEKIVHRDADFS